MLIFDAPPAAVKPADVFEVPSPIATALVDADDFGPADDSPEWDAMAAESGWMDAYEAGCPF